MAADTGKTRHKTNLLLWLPRGMKVKRYVLLALIGGLITITGTIFGVLWAFNERRSILSEPIEQFITHPTWLRIGVWVAAAALIGGVWLVVYSVKTLNRSLIASLAPSLDDAPSYIYERVLKSRGPAIVAFGGGTGLSKVLRGLREYTSNLTAVVAVTDDGGSSGRLREAFAMPAPGDLTDCFAALAPDESELKRLLDYRFARGGELSGHTFGNLLVATLDEVEGDFERAVRSLNQILNLQGAVYPATGESVVLHAHKGEVEIVGESSIRDVAGPVSRVELDPPAPQALPEVLDAIREAELIVLSPGSLFSSLLPPLLVPEVLEAVRYSSAKVVYVANLLPEPGETEGFGVAEHIAALRVHNVRQPDCVLLHRGRKFPGMIDHSLPQQLLQQGIRPVYANLVHDTLPTHDEKHIASGLVGIIGRGRYKKVHA